MTAVLGRILFESFLSVDIIRFKPLNEQARLEHSSINGLVVEFRVVLKVKATDAMQVTLRNGFTKEAALGSLTIVAIAVGGRYLRECSIKYEWHGRI